MRVQMTLLFVFMAIVAVNSRSFAAELVLNPNDGRRILVVDREGNLFTDSGGHAIAAYTKTGRFIRTFGQRGQGPGDIRRLAWFALHPSEKILYVTEYVHGNRWVSRFSTDGTYLGEWPGEIDWRKTHALGRIDFDSSGHVYVQAIRLIYRRHKEFSIGSAQHTILKFASGGKKIKALYVMTYDFSAEKGGKGNVTIPFSNDLHWIIHNDRLFVRESIHSHIAVYRLDGAPEKQLPLPFPKLPVTEKDLQEWQDWMETLPFVKRGTARGYFDLEYWRRKLPFPEYRPISASRMFIDDDGYLYSNQYTSGKNIWARVDIRTGKSGTVSLDPGLNILAMHHKFVYTRKGEEQEKNTIFITSRADLGLLTP